MSQTPSTHSVAVDYQCILHIGPSNTEAIHPFTDELWTKVHLAAQTRKQQRQYANSKYSLLCNSLPAEFSIADGYHSNCYKNFTAIPKGSCKNQLIQPVTTPTTTDCHLLRSSLTPTTSNSSGVWE
jgi:hypothetical protein